MSAFVAKIISGKQNIKLFNVWYSSVGRLPLRGEIDAKKMHTLMCGGDAEQKVNI